MTISCASWKELIRGPPVAFAIPPAISAISQPGLILAAAPKSLGNADHFVHLQA
jgi:hypothetical protein